MSHFTCLVITDVEPTQECLAEILQPWHEYECTGIKDQYVVWIDHDDEVRAQWTGEKREDYWSDDFKPTKDYKTIDDFAEDYHGYRKNDQGRFGRYTNPNAKWDWWQIGGRWSGSLLTTDASGELGEAGVMGSNYDRDNPRACDVIRRDKLDLDGMKKRAVERRRGAVDEWHKRYNKTKKNQTEDAGVPFTPLTLEQFKALAVDHSLCVAQARAAWESAGKPGAFHEFIDQSDHDSCQRLRVHHKENSNVFGPFSLDLPEGTTDVDAWIDGTPALGAFAVVKDGQWYQRGEMGWFGMSTDEMEPEQWQAQLHELVEQTPPDHWLVMVDCHI